MDGKQKENATKPLAPKKPDKKEAERRQAEQFKRRYFDFYDDVKISVKEDW